MDLDRKSIIMPAQDFPTEACSLASLEHVLAASTSDDLDPLPVAQT